MTVISSLRNLTRKTIFSTQQALKPSVKAVVGDSFKVSEATVKSVINSCEKKIKNAPIEIGIIIDPKTAKILQEVEGTEFKVSFSKFKDLCKNKIITHNHPSGNKSALSDGDIAFAFNNKPEQMRAICGDLVHILRVPENFSLNQISKNSLKEAREYLKNENLSMISNLPFHEKIPSFNQLYKKGLYYTKRSIENINLKDLSQAIKDLYNYSVMKERNKGIDIFEKQADSWIYSEPFFNKVYNRFTKMVPGTSFVIENL